MTDQKPELLGPEALRDLRKRCLAGETIEDEELSLVLATLRNERNKIGVAGGRKDSSGRKRQPLDLGALFDKGDKK